MSITVLLRHGVPGPSDAISYAQNFANAYRLVDAALAVIPETQRLPRPIIESAPEFEAIRMAGVIADALHTKRVTSDALSERIDRALIDNYVHARLADHAPTIVVSHGPTIEVIVATFIAMSKKPYQIKWVGNLPRLGGVVVNSGDLTITTVEAQPVKPDGT